MAAYYNHLNLVFLTLSLFVLIHTATSLRCYVCTSQTEEDCQDPFNITTHTTDICDLPDAVCVKQKIGAVGRFLESVHRACVGEDYCKFFEKTSRHCSICKKDYCNSSTSILPSFIILTLLPSFCIYKYLTR